MSARADGHKTELVVNRAMLARLMGVPADTVADFTREGMPVLQRGAAGRESQYDAVACLAWWRARRTAGASEQESRVRYYQANASKIELEVRHRLGEVVDAAEVEERWAAMVAACRERLLSLHTVALQQGLITSAAEDGLLRLVDEALADLAARGTRERQRA